MKPAEKIATKLHHRYWIKDEENDRYWGHEVSVTDGIIFECATFYKNGVREVQNLNNG